MDLNAIATKWQKKWEDAGIFAVSEDRSKEKFYCLEMYPYPSASLHMGHLRNYSIGDALARFKRMNGFNVLYPMGYDAFGLPAENAAIKNKVDPEEWTKSNMASIKKQQQRMGLSYDWSRELASLYPDYYKWNQWIFLKMFEKGLAYKKKALVNWCPGCNTVLANEQVENGNCWRCRSEVEEKNLEQWFFKITEYADQLLTDLEKLENWPKRVKIMQENWIGKSEGVEIHFKVKDSDIVIPAFTTRADTIFSVTFLVLSPEHPLVEKLSKGKPEEQEVLKTVKEIQKQSIIERTDPEGKSKLGAFTGSYCINPATEDEIPIYIANFALMDYGTGAVMADAHDERDFEFARKYNIPLKFVISPDGKHLDAMTAAEAYTDDGILFDSGDFSGKHNRDALPLMKDWLVKNNAAEKKVNFKLRDWLISRQRYWGTPIPIIYCEKCGIVPVPIDILPVLLPNNAQFTGEGNPLATVKDFVETACPTCGGDATRDTDTMDTFVDSSWYFIRFCSPKFDTLPFEAVKANYWMPVDQYIGGIEHAVMHLLYARFFTKVLRDLGLISVDEPFKRLLCQGMVIKDGAKMSKSIGNVVDPSKIMDNFGPDTARLFILFAALPEKELDWNDQGVEGAHRFLRRVHKLVEDNREAISKDSNNELGLKDKQLSSKTHLTIKRVTEYIDQFSYNIAIGSLMEFVNYLQRHESAHPAARREAIKSLILLLHPFTPHLTEELWEVIGEDGFLSQQSWPKSDESKIDKKIEAAESMIELLRHDITTVLSLAGTEEPSKITLITSSSWKRELFINLKEQLSKTRDFKEILNSVMIKEHGKEISALVQKALKDASILPEVVLTEDEERAALDEHKDSLKSFSKNIIIVPADESYHPKATSALPGKPAIVVDQ